jgi:predicted N-acetyltransferase YhbS
MHIKARKAEEKDYKNIYEINRLAFIQENEGRLIEKIRKGVGSKLIKKGIEKAKEFGFDSIIVLDHENYYPKFGFKRASNWNIKCSFEVPDKAFMAIELIHGTLEEKSGTVK